MSFLLKNYYVLDKTSWIQLFTNFVITLYSALLNGIDDVLEKNVMNSELIKFLTENSK